MLPNQKTTRKWHKLLGGNKLKTLPPFVQFYAHFVFYSNGVVRVKCFTKVLQMPGREVHLDFCTTRSVAELKVRPSFASKRDIPRYTLFRG